MSMLVPLETLPGWPAAPNPPALHSLAVLIGIPAVAFIVIAIFGKISAANSKASGGLVSTTDTVWLGASPKSLGTDGDEKPAIEAAEATSSGSTRAGSKEIGGASARW